MSPALSPRAAALTGTAREVVRKHPQNTALATLAQQNTDEGVRDCLEAALREVETLSRRVRRADFDTSEREKQARYAIERAQRDTEGTKMLADASRKVDAYLARGGSFQGRIDEGRTSLTRFKLDTLLRELVRGEVIHRDGALVVTIDPQKLREVQDTLTQGQQGWIEFVLREVDRDLRLTLHDAWSVLDMDLPVPPPELPALTAPWSRPELPSPWWQAPTPPALEIPFALKGFWEDLLRTLRQQATAMMMLLSVVGLGAFRGSPWIALLGLLVLPVGTFVVMRDRQKQVQELTERGLKTCSDDLQRWVEVRLDRTRAKIRDDIAYQLQVPLRAAWKEWFRQEVLPRQAQAQERSLKARREQEDARKARQDFERTWTGTDVERLRELLREAVAETLPPEADVAE